MTWSWFLKSTHYICNIYSCIKKGIGCQMVQDVNFWPKSCSTWHWFIPEYLLYGDGLVQDIITIELRWVELEGNVKMCLSFQKFDPPKFRNFREKYLVLTSDSFIT